MGRTCAYECTATSLVTGDNVLASKPKHSTYHGVGNFVLAVWIGNICGTEFRFGERSCDT